MNFCINNLPASVLANIKPYVKKLEETESSTSELDGKSAAEIFEAHANGKISSESFAAFQKQWVSQARKLDIGMTNEEFMAKLASRQAPILFDFDEDGSVSIRSGLSREDHLRAVTIRNSMLARRPGIGNTDAFWLRRDEE